MSYLQLVFLLATACVAGLAWHMAMINRGLRSPGVGWWTAGYGSIAAAFLTTGLSVYVGEWGKTHLSHLLLTLGMGLVWLGTRKFLNARVQPAHYVTLGVVLGLEAAVITWYSFVDPVFQVRVTMTCLVLFFFSIAITLTLFSARYADRAVTAAGVCYSLFALLNGLRTISLLLTPNPFSYFLSDTMAKAITTLTLPTLLAAQVACLFMLRGRGVERREPEE